MNIHNSEYLKQSAHTVFMPSLCQIDQNHVIKWLSIYRFAMVLFIGVSLKPDFRLHLMVRLYQIILIKIQFNIQSYRKNLLLQYNFILNLIHSLWTIAYESALRSTPSIRPTSIRP